MRVAAPWLRLAQSLISAQSRQAPQILTSFPSASRLDKLNIAHNNKMGKLETSRAGLDVSVKLKQLT